MFIIFISLLASGIFLRRNVGAYALFLDQETKNKVKEAKEAEKQREKLAKEAEMAQTAEGKVSWSPGD